METITIASRAKTILMYCLIICMIVFTVNCFGQDTIITRKGEKILGKVLEVSPKEIKYKKVGNNEGPLYVEEKSVVIKIKYSNGSVDSFPEIKPWLLSSSKTEIIPVLKTYPELKKIGNRYWYGDKVLSENEMQDVLLHLDNSRITEQVRIAKQAKKWQYIGFLAIPLGIISAGYLIAGLDPGTGANYETPSRVFIGLAAVCVGASFHFKISRKQKNAQAVRLYKQYY